MYQSTTYLFSKILLDGLHLSDNGIYCFIMNIGDINSYWAAFPWLFARFSSQFIRVFIIYNNNKNSDKLSWKILQIPKYIPQSPARCRPPPLWSHTWSYDDFDEKKSLMKKEKKIHDEKISPTSSVKYIPQSPPRCRPPPSWSCTWSWGRQTASSINPRRTRSSSGSRNCCPAPRWCSLWANVGNKC